MDETAAAAIARTLADAGIERVLGLPGGDILVLMDELRRAERRGGAGQARTGRLGATGGDEKQASRRC